ncbi:MAG: tyrosine-type recombinase/integrase [Clostridia bacterium]|nr:tyrosine-type recombinase/integrase [Clostridia bacterium]
MNFNKDKHKWVSTGLTDKGNKRKAEEKLNEILREYEGLEIEKNLNTNTKSKLLFSDYLLNWFLNLKGQIEEITYEGYQHNVNEMVEYFKAKYIYLTGLNPYHIQEYYAHIKKRGISNNTVLHHHVILRKALQNAVKTDLITSNPCDKIDRPQKEQYKAEFYNKKELKELFEVIIGDPLELIIHIAAYYGLRRSEVLGLKWSAIDYENKMIRINHKVVETKQEGLICKNKMKNKSSNRTLPLISHIEQMLLIEKQKQIENKKLCGKSYCTKYQEYVCVNSIGELIRPDYLTQHIRVIQNQFKLKRIRFHDLRHSCASLMLASGVPMKQIQEWLGHSTFQTTADIYAHLDYSSKISSAESISKALDFEEESKPEIVKEVNEEKSLENLQLEIESMQNLLKEKLNEQQRQKRKQSDSEM